jgi:hypothetical protein
MLLSGGVEIFNFVNKLNVQAVNTFFTRAGQATAAYDPHADSAGTEVELIEK